MHIKHTLKPIFNQNSKILILGSIPSIASRKLNFYYAHPKNRFWKILSEIYNEHPPKTKEEKINFLFRHNIALYDVLKSCDIKSSSDSSIKNPIPNDLSPILKKSNIKAIFTTGKKAYELYQKHCYPTTKIKAIYLPSTSPANCPKEIEEKLINTYSQIKKITDK